MTPDSPQDPQKASAAAGGRGDARSAAGVDETTGKLAEEAKAAKEEAPVEAEGQPEPKPKRRRAKKAAPEAEATAAAETGVDKTAAASAAEGGRGDERSEAGASEAVAKPKRSRAKKAAAPAADESAGAEPSAAAEPAKKTKKEPAKDAPGRESAAPARESGAPARRRDRRPAAEPGVLVRAQARYVRTSARKARLVCDHIRGKDVVEARAILAFTPRAAAKPWLKLLESAVANAEHNHELVGEDLRIAAVHADEGPTLKRFRPRAMGRATRIRKRTSHLTITLTPKEG
jgi:ribosomal protein L22